MRVLSALCVVAVCVSAANIPFKSCATGPTKATLNSFSMTPSPPVEGTNTTISYAGTLNEAVTGGQYSLKISLFGVNVVAHTGSVCANSVIPLPIPKGLNLALEGLTCPSGPGNFNLEAIMTTATIAPPSGTFDITFDAKDQNGGELFCASATLQL